MFLRATTVKAVLIVCIGWFFLSAASCSSGPQTKIPVEGSIDAYESDPHIRVALADKVVGCTLSIPGPFHIYATYSQQLLTRGDSLSAVSVRSVPEGIVIDKKLLSISSIRIIPAPKSHCEINGYAYRGEIRIQKDSATTLAIINRVRLEDYLRGVVPAEMPAGWPRDALVAQAIAARTWALNRIFLKQDTPFDVYADQRSQVYGGMSSETAATNSAVDFSRGVVLTFGGRIFPAYFHSYCGGHTESGAEVFQEPVLTPLSGAPCRFCLLTRKGEFTWSRPVSERDFKDALARNGHTVPAISSVRPLRGAAQVHCSEFEIVTPGTSFHVKGTDLRKWLGLRSTAVSTVKKEGDTFVFTGAGFGHGVGLCQWGAFGQAQNSFDYQDILKYYYPGAKFSSIKRGH